MLIGPVTGFYQGTCVSAKAMSDLEDSILQHSTLPTSTLCEPSKGDTDVRLGLGIAPVDLDLSFTIFVADAN